MGYCETADKGCVLTGFATTQAVVQVAKDEAVTASSDQQVQKGHGVTPAGDGEEGGLR